MGFFVAIAVNQPDTDSVIRLGGSILMEQHDEWAADERRFMSAESMTDLYLQSFLLSPHAANILST